ncbi:MAG: glycoside hydrolase family 36 protein, partial [Leadbetterella sp.]
VELKTPKPQVFVHLIYTTYAELPFVRKQVQVINKSGGDMVLTNLDVERLNMVVKDTYMNEVYANYGTNMTRIPYKGDYNDAAIYLFNPVANQGVLLGNEAPSVLKRTEIYVHPGRLAMGMGRIDESFPFKKFLAPGETFKSPRTFISFTNHPKWQYAFEDKYQDFIRQKLGVQLFERKNKPFFIYNTWQPFFDDINAPLVRQCADNLANTGTDLFIIDAGWYKRAGDFNADPVKFPEGMKPVCQYIKSKGMQVGVWFTISSVHAQSQIAKEHPEWLIKDKNGKTANLHDDQTAETGEQWHSAIKTMSLGSPYYDHIKNVVRGYVNDWGISYLKLDLSIANSAYVYDLERTGDYETNPSKLYRDRASSYWTIYERVMSLMDDLHQEFPNLLLDCTFEVWGRYNVVDYALVQHGDYDWLTNFDYAPPTGAISIRQMAYDRARVVPASTLLIGNQFMDFPNYPYVYFSVAASSTLMVGDPRKLTPADKQFYNTWNTWFKKMESKYQCSQYRQIYDVFDRPTDSNWDGVYKFNTEKQGGLLFFFKNNSSDNSRTFRIPCLNPSNTYNVYHLDKLVGTFSGKDLINTGFTVSIAQKYAAMVYSIEKK